MANSELPRVTFLGDPSPGPDPSDPSLTVVSIEGTTAAAFQKLASYLLSGSVDHGHFLDSLALYSLADRYDLPALGAALEAALPQKINSDATVEELIHLHAFGALHGRTDLQELSLLAIERQPQFCYLLSAYFFWFSETPSFHGQLSADLLGAIISRDTLGRSNELDVYNLVANWAAVSQRQAENRGKSRRELLGQELLFRVRFTLISWEDLLGKVFTDSLLTGDDVRLVREAKSGRVPNPFDSKPRQWSIPPARRRRQRTLCRRPKPV